MKPPQREEQNTNDPENIPVTPFPIRLLTGALMLTVGVLLTMGWSAYDSYRNFVTVQLHDVWRRAIFVGATALLSVGLLVLPG